VKGVRIRIYKKIRTPLLCDEYLSWIPYISLDGAKESVLDLELEMVFKIKVSKKSFSWEVVCLWHWK
jgi:hypothetical protein